MGTCISCCHDPRESHKNGHIQSIGSATSSNVARDLPVRVTVADNVNSSKYAVQCVTASTSSSDHGNGKHTNQPPMEIQVDRSAHSNGGETHVARASSLVKSAVSIPGKRVPSVSSKEHSLESKINALFNVYFDETEDCILAEGIERFCSDLDIKPDDFRILVLAWKFNANVMCRFTRQEFVSGCKKIKADSTQSILTKMPELLTEVRDKTTFRTFYRWAFRFALDVDSGQRTLPLDIALQLWPLVFTHNEPRILSSWLEYLSKHQTVRGIPRDTWDMFLNFTDCVKDGFANYDDTEAWPSLFDNFVEYETDRQNQNVADKVSLEP